VLHVHVQPRAGKDEVTGRHGDALRVRVHAPPVDGRATEAVKGLLAVAFGIPAGRVVLVSGERSRLKRYRLRGLARRDAEARLATLLDGGPDPASTSS
jgi:uncharacterized protein (TIGR00251 family)